MLSSRFMHIALLLIAVVAVQVGTQMTGKEFYLTQLIMAAYYSLIIIGLCLLMGFAGQISLGHAGFFAIGGYATAFLTTFDFTLYKDGAVFSILAQLRILISRQDLYGGTALSFEPWAAFLIAILGTILIAFMIGIPVLKLKGHYLAMATLGFGTIIYSIVLGTQKFGAADGISGVPPFVLVPGLSVSGAMPMRIRNYYIAWSLVALGMLLLQNLIHSRIGRALRSIHSAEDAANAMGVDTARFKLNTFVLSAVFAAVAGVFLTHFNGGIGPSEASIMKSIRYVAIVAVGGMSSLWGTLAMSVILNFLSLRGYFGAYDDAVFGGILILIMLFSPEGILRLNVHAFIRRLFRAQEGVKVP